MTSDFNGGESVARSTAQAGAEALTPPECWRRLADTRIDRLVCTEHGLPAVTVNDCVLDGDSILFTTRDDALLQAAERGDLVAFAVDPGDVRHSAGRSLTVIGHLSKVQPDEVDSLGAHPWSPRATTTPLILRLRVESMTGHATDDTGGAPILGADRAQPIPSPLSSAAAQRFAELAVELHDSGSVEGTVDAAVQFALQALNCSHAGIALAVRGGRPEVPAVTDAVVTEIYQFQMQTGVGPLVEAMRRGATVLVRDTAADERWPDWAGKVLSLGVRSVLDVPLTTTAGTIGVLGLYSTEPDAFAPDDEAIADILARHASVALANARRDESMARAVDARKVVGQAMGILMERYGIDGDQAFAVLKRYSQDTNTKLRDVAQELIDTRALPH
jgi:hypothetical protein